MGCWRGEHDQRWAKEEDWRAGLWRAQKWGFQTLFWHCHRFPCKAKLCYGHSQGRTLDVSSSFSIGDGRTKGAHQSHSVLLVAHWPFRIGFSSGILTKMGASRMPHGKLDNLLFSVILAFPFINIYEKYSKRRKKTLILFHSAALQRGDVSCSDVVSAYYSFALKANETTNAIVLFVKVRSLIYNL